MALRNMRYEGDPVLNKIAKDAADKGIDWRFAGYDVS